jgi:serine/threonine protein kinase
MTHWKGMPFGSESYGGQMTGNLLLSFVTESSATATMDIAPGQASSVGQYSLGAGSPTRPLGSSCSLSNACVWALRLLDARRPKRQSMRVAETGRVEASSACFDDAVAASYISGDLTPEERERVDAHVDACASCRRHVSELARLHTTPPDRSRAGSSDIEAPLAPLSAGTNVGRYVIDGPIGAGGMGVVYAAHDPQLHRKVALKRVLGGFSPASQKRLLREAQAMARLSHSNVVAVHDLVFSGPEIFIAMEYVDGVTLKEWLHEATRPYPQVLNAFRDAGRGLAAAHAVGLVHGDFKPANVMVDRAGRVRVTDFGLAREPEDRVPPSDAPDPGTGDGVDGRSLVTRTVAGTPAYMAPEGRESAAVDARSDQFSFAVALYEALYGEHPFGGESGAEMLERASRGVVRASSAGSRVPARVRSLLLRGLRTAPDERFAQMGDLLDELSRSFDAKRPVFASNGSKLGIAVLSLGLVVVAAGIWARSGLGKDDAPVGAGSSRGTSPASSATVLGVPSKPIAPTAAFQEAGPTVEATGQRRTPQTSHRHLARCAARLSPRRLTSGRARSPCPVLLLLRFRIPEAIFDL